MTLPDHNPDFDGPLITCENVVKTYKLGEQVVNALAGVSMQIEQGEYVAIMGPSGSGKSTMMNLIGALDVPTSGDISIGGHNLASMKPDDMATLRNETLGFVFQQFNLLSRQTALANVMLPMRYSDRFKGQHQSRAQEALNKVGLGDRLDHKPTQLSGGQQQRVAIARALANAPKIILADEPTGALDTKTSEEIMDLLTELNESGITVILVTHEDEVAAYAKRRIGFRDGKIETDRKQGEPA